MQTKNYDDNCSTGRVNKSTSNNLLRNEKESDIFNDNPSNQNTYKGWNNLEKVISPDYD